MARGGERDSQRRKLYNAEGVLAVFGDTKLPEVADMVRFTKRVWSYERVRKAWPLAITRYPFPVVKPGKGRRRAGGDEFGIYMPRHTRDEHITLHELAHTITRREHGNKVAGHGWQYCDIYLRLVLYVLGREAHNAFKASMKSHRVRFRKPNKRKLLHPAVTAMRTEQLARGRATARANREARKAALAALG